MGETLMAVVAEGSRGRLYCAPSPEQVDAAAIGKPDDYPDAKIAANPRDFKTPNYGLEAFSQLFTNRQLTALTTFSDLVHEAQEQAEKDALAAGLPDDGVGLADHGTGARAYGEAVGVYLAFLVDQLTNQCSSICGWNAPNTQMRTVFCASGHTYDMGLCGK